MSIICGAMKWLIDHETKTEENLRIRMKELNDKLEEIESESTGDWINDHSKQMVVNQEKRLIQEQLEMIDRRVKRKESLKQMVETKIADKNKKKVFHLKKKNTNEVEVEKEENEKGKIDDVDLLLEEYAVKSDDSDEEKEEEEERKHTQFYLCSRTHSQLSQFIGEVKKSPYSEKISLVPIGSRYLIFVSKGLT